MLAEEIAESKAWLVSSSGHINSMGFFVVVTVLEMTIICHQSQNKPEKACMCRFLFFLCTCQTTHKNSSLIFMTRTRCISHFVLLSRWQQFANKRVIVKMTLWSWKPQMDGPCSLSESEGSFFFNNRVLRLPAIVLLIHLSGCMTSVTKPEPCSISSSKCASKFPTLSSMTNLFCWRQV